MVAAATRRLFLALGPTPDMAQAAARVQAYYQQAAAAPTALRQARWVRPEGAHLTLFFFGDVPADQVAAVTDACHHAIASAPCPPLDLRLAGLGTFDAEHPRVLWMGIDGDAAKLAALQADVARVLTARGYHARDPVFHPHITVGRLREQLSPAERAAVAAALPDLEADAAPLLYGVPTICFREATLYESHRQAGGSVYEPLATFAFAELNV